MFHAFFSEFKIKLIFIVESNFKRAMNIFTFFPPKSIFSL